MSERVNIGRRYSGGIFHGLFGNPVLERTVSLQYRKYLKQVIVDHPKEVAWLQDKLDQGAVLYCPGCGIGSPTCHARLIEDALMKWTSLSNLDLRNADKILGKQARLVTNTEVIFTICSYDFVLKIPHIQAQENKEWYPVINVEIQT